MQGSLWSIAEKCINRAIELVSYSTLNIIGGKIKSLLKKEEIKINSLDRWVACKFTNVTKTLLLIIIYRTP